VRSFSLLGEHAALWLVLGGAGIAVDAPRRGRWRRAVVSVATAYVANTGLKVAVRRRRPALEGLPPLAGTPTGLSFPSAHATSSFAAARAYSALVPGPPLCALSLSRLYLGVHYPYASLAGMALGTAVGQLGR